MPRTPTLSNVTILVVEDNPDIRTSVGRFLERKGANVVTTPDALQGLKAVKEHRPDLVLSDISLPLWSGFRLLQEIRALETGTGIRVPVIAMTAFANLAGSPRTLAAGFQAHLDKPFTSEQLLEVIHSVLEM